MDSNQPSKIGLKGFIPLAELLRQNRNRKLRHLALGSLGGMASNGRKAMILTEMKRTTTVGPYSCAKVARPSIGKGYFFVRKSSWHRNSLPLCDKSGVNGS